MNAGASTISLTYLASMRAVPGYGGGMNAAKAALESDTKYWLGKPADVGESE